MGQSEAIQRPLLKIHREERIGTTFRLSTVYDDRIL